MFMKAQNKRMVSLDCILRIWLDFLDHILLFDCGQGSIEQVSMNFRQTYNWFDELPKAISLLYCYSVHE